MNLYIYIYTYKTHPSDHCYGLVRICRLASLPPSAARDLSIRARYRVTMWPCIDLNRIALCLPILLYVYISLCLFVSLSLPIPLFTSSFSYLHHALYFSFSFALSFSLPCVLYSRITDTSIFVISTIIAPRPHLCVYMYEY